MTNGNYDLSVTGMNINITDRTKLWLKKKINDQFTENIYSESLLPPRYMGRHRDELFYKYYTDDDIDVQHTDSMAESVRYIVDNNIQSIDHDDRKMIDCLEIYGDRTILLAPCSNQTHVNYLFKSLMDRSEQMMYQVPLVSQTGKVVMRTIPMFNSTFKNKFYNFCYDYSSH